MLDNIVNVSRKKRCPLACDGMILKLHYQWTVFLFLAGFSTVWYSWYYKDTITCRSLYNSNLLIKQQHNVYVEICLSYPYIEETTTTTTKRRYILFYKWTHWIFLVMAGIYYIPHKISKNCENPKVKKLIEDLFLNYKKEEELLEKVKQYFDYSLNTHNSLYYNFLLCNIVALNINIVSFFFLDFILQGCFMYYGWEAYPYRRDPVHFMDYMSKTFPPFVKCQLTPVNKLTSKRIENIACHLTMMELYEKLFLVIWVWLIILLLITIIYIIFFLIIFFVPSFSIQILKMSKPYNFAEYEVRYLRKYCKVGDIYLFYCLKQCLSQKQFYELLVYIIDNHSKCVNFESI